MFRHIKQCRKQNSSFLKLSLQAKELRQRWEGIDFVNNLQIYCVPFFRFAIKLLEDVVFFVADVINSGQPVLDVVMSKANRERQKLMREQNILKQV